MLKRFSKYSVRALDFAFGQLLLECLGTSRSTRRASDIQHLQSLYTNQGGKSVISDSLVVVKFEFLQCLMALKEYAHARITDSVFASIHSLEIWKRSEHVAGLMLNKTCLVNVKPLK